MKEFLWQANAAGLITAEEFDFDDGLESEYSWVWGGKEELHKLFPFDPCLLRNSDRFVVALNSSFQCFLINNTAGKCCFENQRFGTPSSHAFSH